MNSNSNNSNNSIISNFSNSIFSNSNFSNSNTNQIVGRGTRTESHSHLPVTPVTGVHIYARVSSEGQNNLPGHHSLETQIQGCREYCQNNNIPIREIWQEIGSARDMNNLTIQKRMLRQVRAGEQIMFYNITRFSRNTAQGLNLIEKLKQKGVSVFSVTEGVHYHGSAAKHLFRTTLSVAENESDQISDRVRSSIAYRRSIGSELGQAPYGKLAVRELSNGARKFVTNEDEMRIIDTIVQMHYNGDLPFEIAQRLNSRNVLKRNKPWTYGKVMAVIYTHARLRPQGMRRALDDIINEMESDRQNARQAEAEVDMEEEEEESSEDVEMEEESQPIAKRVKRDIRRRSRSRSRGHEAAPGAPLRFKRNQ